MTDANDRLELLHARISRIVEEARDAVARTINVAMVESYWMIGREIVQVEQEGELRAAYGLETIERLSKQLKATLGKGFSVQNLRSMRQFFLAFPDGYMIPEIRQTVSGESAAIRQTPSGVSTRPKFSASLSWSHYVALLRVTRPAPRSFYEIEASRERWSVRQLERQIASQLFERLAHHRNPTEVSTLSRVDGPRSPS